LRALTLQYAKNFYEKKILTDSSVNIQCVFSKISDFKKI
jgi:hypothetical protein